MFKKKTQSEGILIREKTFSLFEKTLKESYHVLKLILGGILLDISFKHAI